MSIQNLILKYAKTIIRMKESSKKQELSIQKYSLSYNLLFRTGLDVKQGKLFKTLRDGLRRKIREHGFVQEDKRLGRITQSLPGHFSVIRKSLIDELTIHEPLLKYSDDWWRIVNSGLPNIIAEAKKDKNSRRLMVFNDQDYQSIFQCFTSFQFVYTERKKFDMYVYQRSSDLDKLHDDLIFYTAIARFFQRNVMIPVTKIVIIFGHIHYGTGKIKK